jgi:hypothetical protein
MAELRHEHLMQLRANLGEPLIVGDVPKGLRRILHFTGGSFAGSKLLGEILPGGGDWVLRRGDGFAELDIRMTLRTADGALIYMQSQGLFQQAPEDYFRTSQRFETSAADYQWLNRRLAVGVGTRTKEGMVTESFTIL